MLPEELYVDDKEPLGLLRAFLDEQFAHLPKFCGANPCFPVLCCRRNEAHDMFILHVCFSVNSLAMPSNAISNVAGNIYG